MSALFSRALPLCLLFLLLSGCASEGVFAHRDTACVGDDCTGPQFVQFERGQPHVVVDSVGWVFGIPSRILLWNWEVKNHDISHDTEQQLREYVAVNDLQDVKVRLNQYDPGGEWQRLAHNDRIAPGWRYTIGALSTVGYTVFPGRLFAIDYYNPFTNTVNVYSDVPALGMKEVAYAGDVIDRDLPGTYAVSQLIPGVSLVHETITTREVLDYVAATGSVESHEEAVHVLYPSYGGSVGGAVDIFLPTAPVMQLGGVIVGHVSGRMETRDWASADPMLLSDNELEATEIQLTPPQQFFADIGALPVALSRTVRRQVASLEDVAASAPAATPQLVESNSDAADAGATSSDAVDSDPAVVAGNAEPAVTDEAPDGEIMQASFEEPADVADDELPAGPVPAEPSSMDGTRPSRIETGTSPSAYFWSRFSGVPWE